jgi:hypothetical protein
MRAKAIWILCAIALGAVALATAGCGGGGNKEAETVTVTVPSTETTLTDTTAAEETTTEETTTTEEATTSEEATTEETDTEATGTDTTALGDLGFLTSANCREFLQFAQSVGAAMSGDNSDAQAAADKMKQYADQAPEEIRDDWRTLADYYAKLADAMKGVDKNDSTAVLAAVLKVARDADSAKLTAASQHFSTWLTQNCSNG